VNTNDVTVQFTPTVFAHRQSSTQLLINQATGQPETLMLTECSKINVNNFMHAKTVNQNDQNQIKTRMWANAQRDGRPDAHRWRPLFNAAKFG